MDSATLVEEDTPYLEDVDNDNKDQVDTQAEASNYISSLGGKLGGRGPDDNVVSDLYVINVFVNSLFLSTLMIVYLNFPLQNGNNAGVKVSNLVASHHSVFINH